jgi:hypothetical protein
MARTESTGADAHPNDDLLLALNDGVLFPGDRPLVEGHLKGCARCRARLNALTEDISIPTRHTSTTKPLAESVAASVRAVSGSMLRRLGVAAALLAILGSAGIVARRELIRRIAEPVALAPAPTTPVRPVPSGADLPAPPALVAPVPSASNVVTAPPNSTDPNSPPVAPADLLVVTSPDQAFRWRVVGLAVERTTDSGRNWQTLPIEVTKPMAAGAAPSAAVCWLVGRGGAVFLGVGSNWKNVSLTDPVDLVRVSAIDSMNATVTAKDGRQFSTSDAGVRWSALLP